MSAKKQELAVKQETSLSTQTHAPRGFEGFSQEDLIIPRLRLLQGLSKAVVDGQGHMGMYQDSLTEEILGDKVEVILFGMKNGAVYFKPGEGMVCKTTNGITSINGDTCAQCPFGEYWKAWKDDGTPPGCCATKEFLTVTRATVQGTESRPLSVSFMKTSFGLGKKLATLARLANRDIYFRSYILGSEKIKNAKGTFAKLTVSVGSVLNTEELAAAERWYALLTNSNITVADEDDTFDTKSFDEV